MDRWTIQMMELHLDQDEVAPLPAFPDSLTNGKQVPETQATFITIIIINNHSFLGEKGPKC